jgi:methyl-accepting chemotaxis protein
MNNRLKIVQQLFSSNYWRGFKGKYVLSVAFISLVGATSLYLILPNTMRTISTEMFLGQCENLSKVLIESIAISLEFGDYESVQSVFDKLGTSRDILYLNVLDSEQKSVASYRASGVDVANISFDERGWYFGKDLIVQSSPIKLGERTFTLHFGHNIGALQQGTMTMKRNIMIFAIINFCANILVIIILTEILSRTLYLIIERTKDVATGEGDLTQRIEIDSQDEFGELVNWFNLLLQKIREMVMKIKESARKVGETAELISVESEQLASGVQEQQSQLVRINESVSQISGMIEDTTRNVADTKKNASHASLTATDGKQTVDDTIAGIDDIAANIAIAVDQISKLGEKSREIGRVIQVIDDIADQTNLLALNANIEAARAGAAGKGFAVVADEVRKLAERTVKATEEISDKIKEIQKDISGSVAAMQRINEQSQKGRQLANQSGQSLVNIVSSIANVDGTITQLVRAAEEESVAAREIELNLDSVSKVAESAAGSAQNMARSAEQLNREVQILNQLIGQFKV